jgi:hypothetical protein
MKDVVSKPTNKLSWWRARRAIRESGRGVIGGGGLGSGLRFIWLQMRTVNYAKRYTNRGF